MDSRVVSITHKLAEMAGKEGKREAVRAELSRQVWAEGEGRGEVYVWRGKEGALLLHAGTVGTVGQPASRTHSGMFRGVRLVRGAVLSSMACRAFKPQDPKARLPPLPLPAE